MSSEKRRKKQNEKYFQNVLTLIFKYDIIYISNEKKELTQKKKYFQKVLTFVKTFDIIYI